VGVIREHTRGEYPAWRIGVYCVGLDVAMFFGPFASGLLGEEHAGLVVTAVGALAIVGGARACSSLRTAAVPRKSADATGGVGPSRSMMSSRGRERSWPRGRLDRPYFSTSTTM